VEKQRLYRILGIVLLLAGSTVLLFGLPVRWFVQSFQYETLGELKPGEAGFPAFDSAFPAERLIRYGVRHPGGALTLEAAEYRGAGGQPRRVLLPAGDGRNPSAAWQEAASAIRRHTADNTVFLAWWDNGQRVHFFAGREAWAAAPLASAFPDSRQRAFWLEAAGEFAADPRPLTDLARWLTMDAAAALREMEQRLPHGREVHVLVTSDDLARLGEMEALAGVSLALETRIFSGGGNFHGLIAQIKRWAREQGDGNYLVQPLPGGDVRAWRANDAQAGGALIARLLPFTASLTHPLEGLELTFRSQDGYLSVYRRPVR
jgi:hydroxylamine oxidation protein HaoB